MTDSKVPEETAGGPLGKLAGKAKETAGAVLGDEEACPRRTAATGPGRG